MAETHGKLKKRELPQKYDFSEAEPRWQKHWEDTDVYQFPDGEGEVYSVDTPPPTVSGKMHLGHSFSYAQEDFVVRFQRMLGKRVLYPFGTDDNGLPTERLVEKLKKVKSTRMERPEFVKLCSETILEIRDDFVHDWKRIGMSCDFKGATYSTIDSHSIRTSQKSFLDLQQKKLVTQMKAPSMWCVNCQTAIAQAELEDVEHPSSFNDISFEVVETGDTLTIATTRPELLPACVCIFVHPEDERYHHLIGKHARVPLFGQEVEIFADESANPEKGSGVLMICTYGDRFDVDAIKRKKIEPKIAITKDGRMTERAKEFEGLKIKEARKAILEKLGEAGLLTAKKQIVHAVNVHDKCGTEIEFLATKQWFIKVLENKQLLLDAGNNINWYPKSMKARYDNWVSNLNWDWCISRQRHFGVPFPVWYSKKTGEPIFASLDQLPVDPLTDVPKELPAGHTVEDIEPEKDVMDTWATSSVSPQIVTDWAGKHETTQDYASTFPMTMRPQAHDIIRTWAFYTIVKGMYHENTPPWRDIVISGHVLDPKGNKMSKSKGNVIDPRAVVEKYGADALRFWAAGSKLGEDLPYQEKDLVTGKKMVTKLWNASKFAIMHLEKYDGTADGDNLEVIDRWLLAKMHAMIKASTENFEKYEYSRTKQEVEKFFWKDLCDNYLEFAKDRLYNPENYSETAVQSARYALYNGVLTSLKLIAPIMPFITEEVYHLYFNEKDGASSIHISKWPEYDAALDDDEAREIGDIFVDIVSATRKFKSEKQVSLKTPIQNLYIQCDDATRAKLDLVIQDLKAVTHAQGVLFEGGVTETQCERYDIQLGIVLGEVEKKN